jgi:hypothetical protein
MKSFKPKFQFNRVYDIGLDVTNLAYLAHTPWGDRGVRYSLAGTKVSRKTMREAERMAEESLYAWMTEMMDKRRKQTRTEASK